MTDAVQRQLQAWIGKKWEALDKGKELFVDEDEYAFA